MATPAATATTVTSIPWWKEPTRDQWYAFVAAWAGWTLDAFDFTAFLLIIAPIAKEFDVPVPEVAAVLTITLWMLVIHAPTASDSCSGSSKVSIVGSGPLNTETVPRRSSAFPSTSDSAGGSSRSAWTRI